MENNLIPIGSVVLLKGGNKKLLIYGRKQRVVADKEQMYDYIGVPYPEGYINLDYTYVFNHSDIHEIIFTGFSNQEEQEFQKVLSEV